MIAAGQFWTIVNSIPMPDVYLGGKEVDAKLVTWYLDSIVSFLESSGTTPLGIPVGLQDSNVLVARFTTDGLLSMGLLPLSK